MNGYLPKHAPRLAITLTLLVLACTQSNSYDFAVLPTSNYIDVNGSYLAKASPQACYASCQSCQILTNLCEQCYVPYFSKTPQGTCPLTADYTLESASNEIREGAAFTIAAQSWSNEQIVNCSARNNKLNFLGELVAIQPVVPTEKLTYNRTLSLHNYLIIRFELITTNWNAGSLLNISLYNQANNALVPGGLQVNYLPNVPKESLCSAGTVDQRFSVTVKLQDVNTTSLSISMLSTSGTFSVATFAVISGFCDASCSSCSYTTGPTACLGCNYFLKQISDGSCSECPLGFKFTTASGYSFCQKCPIQYQSCSTAQTSCYYSDLSATTSNDCKLTYSNSHYDETYYLNEQTFPGSLFTVNGLPSPSQYVACGNQPLSSYSYVGSALAYQPITRIFTNLRAHLSLSFSFNVFVVDASYTSRNTKFQIYLNGELYDVKYLTLTGMSNVCGGDQLQIFTTFPPTQFYPNNNTDLNLTLVADTTWGLRNLRIAYQVCDDNCLLCGSAGCERCKGYLQVKDGQCQQCPSGFGNKQSASAENACFKCPANCLSCTLGVSGVVECLLCSQPFFLFQNYCKKKTNVADTVTPGPLTPVNTSSASPTSFSLSLPTMSEGSSSLTNSTTSFTLSSTTVKTVTTLSQAHYRSYVQFYLLRVGQWDPSDRIDVYLNDLLMLSKNYSNYGNKWISNTTNATDTDFLSFESLDFTDQNTSLSINFEVVTKNGIARTFGVASLKVYPVGCQSCLIYPFTYRIQYNYDQALNVVVQFSRVYRQTNQDLFKKIFVLTLNGQALPYSIQSNNSVIYTLQAYPPSNVLQGKLKLVCVYPQLVTTYINDSVNGAEPFFSRLLQATSTYSNSKVIDNNDSSTNIVRFVPVEHPDAINGVRTFFQVVTRIVIYVGFALFFLGLQTIGTHFMHNIQKIWLHIFLAALAAPSLLRQALTGFREAQNQNIAVNPSQWQKGLPEQLFYDSRSYFYQYVTDVNFFRNIYNIGLAFGILVVYLAIMHVVSKKYITREMTENNNFLRHWKITFHRRPYFYFNSIVFYQYLTLVLASMLQFTSISNQTNQGAFNGVSAAAAVIAFVLATIYPLAHFLWLRRKQEYLGRGLHIHFANRYHQIFFRFVKREIWADGQITYTQRLYNLYRYGEIWWYCLIVTALAYNPQAQLYLLLITQALHLFLVLYTKLSRNFFFRICKVLELAFFVGLEIIMLVCESQKETLTVPSMRTLGGVAIAFLFVIILLSLARTIYNAYLLHKEYQYKGMEGKIHARQGQVIRRDEYFDSDGEGEELVGTERV